MKKNYLKTWKTGVALILSLVAVSSVLADRVNPEDERPMVQCNGRNVAVIQNVTEFNSRTEISREASDASKSADYTFYEQLGLSMYDRPMMASHYRMELPGPGVPVVTEISGFILVSNITNIEVYERACILIEVYDDYLPIGVGTTPVHSTYLGGALLDFGVMFPGDQRGGTFIFNDVDPDGYAFHLGNDDEVFISVHAGKIIPDPGGSGFDRFVPITEENTLGIGYDAGELAHPVTGWVSGKWYDQSYVAGDRISTANELRWDIMSFDCLKFALKGRILPDCNQNTFPDGDEIACGISLGVPDCSSTGLRCSSYVLDPTEEGLFGDPFGIGYVFSSECDVSPGNGIPDTCDAFDCDANGVRDVCDFDCGETDPLTGLSCAENPLGCGTHIGGDCDGSGIVDLGDYAGMVSCLAGPGGGLGFCCECFDVDQDGDVDMLDFAELQRVFTGS